MRQGGVMGYIFEFYTYSLVCPSLFYFCPAVTKPTPALGGVHLRSLPQNLFLKSYGGAKSTSELLGPGLVVIRWEVRTSTGLRGDKGSRLLWHTGNPDPAARPALARGPPRAHGAK